MQFTASAELRDKLERLRALMRASVPDGDLAAIIEQAVSEKLERLEARYPFGHGGDRGLENIQLLCKSHNLYVAEADYGSQAMARHRSPPNRVSEASVVYSITALSAHDSE